VRPPDHQLYFPTGLVISPDEGTLFAISANSDLRFDSGTLVSIDVAEVAALVDEWLAAPGGVVPADRANCTPDQGFPITLICDECELIAPERTVRIGNFATELKIQELDSGALRLFLAVRGDPSVTYIDVTDGLPDCNDRSDALFAECDDDHRLVQLRDNDDLITIPDEPFGLFVDGVNGYAMVTHLSNGAVSLVDAPRDGAPPVISDALGGIFQRDPNTGAIGAVGVAGRLPGTENDRVYVTSRSEARVQTLLVSRSAGLPTIVAGEFFFLNRVLPSDDARDIAFTDDGARAFIINRDPPMLQVIDTSISETGVPRNELEGAIELCRQASVIELADAGAGTRLYVACFQDGQVWAINPTGLAVESIIDVGRGPQFLASAPSQGLLFVSNFRENSIGVIDIRPGSPTENRVVLRIGRTNDTPERNQCL
jgi:DNA-binding beta-propeller fold protein YncE